MSDVNHQWTECQSRLNAIVMLCTNDESGGTDNDPVLNDVATIATLRRNTWVDHVQTQLATADSLHSTLQAQIAATQRNLHDESVAASALSEQWDQLQRHAQTVQQQRDALQAQVHQLTLETDTFQHVTATQHRFLHSTRLQRAQQVPRLQQQLSLYATMTGIKWDFEAQEQYWTEVNARGLTNNKTLAASYLANATIEVNGDYAGQPFPHDGGWYDKTAAKLQGKVTTFTGPWSKSFNPAAAQIETHSLLSDTSLNPVTELLTENAPNKSTPLVMVEQISANWNSKATSSTSQRITVANGSFLLNYPLVNKEHRKLAALLIQQIASTTPRGEMVFIESGPGGPPIRDHESLAKFSTGLEFFSLPPLGTFLCHLALLGILFCFVRWPIFGRPKEPPRQTGVDFGLHLGALGSLLERTGDRNYARLRLEQYQRSVQKK